MFNPNQGAINKAYRQEQEAHAAKAHLTQSVDDSDKQLNNLLNYARNTNLVASVIFVVAIIVMFAIW